MPACGPNLWEWPNMGLRSYMHLPYTLVNCLAATIWTQSPAEGAVEQLWNTQKTTPHQFFLFLQRRLISGSAKLFSPIPVWILRFLLRSASYFCLTLLTRCFCGLFYCKVSHDLASLAPSGSGRHINVWRSQLVPITALMLGVHLWRLMGGLFLGMYMRL